MLHFIDRLAGKWLDWRQDRTIANYPPELADLKLHKVEADSREFRIVAFAPSIVHLADEAAALLNAENAENYLQFDMQPRLDRGKPPIRVTVAWARGESPAAKAARLEDENTELKRRLRERDDPFSLFPKGAVIEIDVVFPGEYRMHWRYEGVHGIAGTPKYFPFWEAVQRTEEWFIERFSEENAK